MQRQSLSAEHRAELEARADRLERVFGFRYTVEQLAEFERISERHLRRLAPYEAVAPGHEFYL